MKRGSFLQKITLCLIMIRRKLYSVDKCSIYFITQLILTCVICLKINFIDIHLNPSRKDRVAVHLRAE